MTARINRAAWALSVAFAWLWTWRHLSIEWRTSEQYQFGFGVPFLCAYIAWKRWSGPLAPALTGPGSACVLACAWVVFVLGELLRWHDPIWRATGALLALGSTLLAAVWFRRTGGTPLLRRELFPLAFAWLAVPWPVPVELFITQHLLHGITSTVVALAGSLGIAALQHGSTIELAGGMVGMDDACSGIRSLQATVMASLFLGEFFQLTIGRRAALLAGGAAAAMSANFLRVLALTGVLHANGSAAEAGAHDPVGGAATALTFAALLLLAKTLSRRTPGTVENHRAFPVLRGIDGFAVLACTIAAPLLVWLWFSTVQTAPGGLPQTAQWKLETSRLPRGWTAVPVEPTATMRASLQFSAWQAVRLQSAEGWTAEVIHLVWKPGSSMPSMAFYHTPAMCMPWAGWEQVGEPALLSLDVLGSPLPCVAYRFRQGGVTQVVIQCLSSGGKNAHHLVDPDHIGGRGSRLATLWRAPLRQVNEELLLYMPDLGSMDLQTKTFTELLDQVLAKSQP